MWNFNLPKFLHATVQILYIKPLRPFVTELGSVTDGRSGLTWQKRDSEQKRDGRPGLVRIKRDSEKNGTEGRVRPDTTLWRSSACKATGLGSAKPGPEKPGFGWIRNWTGNEVVWKTNSRSWWGLGVRVKAWGRVMAFTKRSCSSQGLDCCDPAKHAHLPGLSRRPGSVQ